ncbi:hypothetical protein PINS_up021439 [Pythium insidiosum]|nr:hypothetical protein PINS_up021439 [Pythium insidiosum]
MLKSTKGTYQFLPPEALSGGEFDGFKADIWAVGVTLYALKFGFLPFFSNDMIKLFEKIEQDPLVFPTDCQDEELKDLISRLLEKDPEKRISVEATLQHPWLHRHIDSKALQQQVRALKRTPALSVDEKELGGAVSVLQTRFQVLSNAVRQNTLASVEQSSIRPSTVEAVDDWANFSPRPVDTSTVVIPDWMRLDIPMLATQVHFDFCHSMLLDGWKYGPSRDDTARIHPALSRCETFPSMSERKTFGASKKLSSAFSHSAAVL